jgi:hypothetical protein
VGAEAFAVVYAAAAAVTVLAVVVAGRLRTARAAEPVR